MCRNVHDIHYGSFKLILLIIFAIKFNCLFYIFLANGHLLKLQDYNKYSTTDNFLFFIFILFPPCVCLLLQKKQVFHFLCECLVCDGETLSRCHLREGKIKNNLMLSVLLQNCLTVRNLVKSLKNMEKALF